MHGMNTPLSQVGGWGGGLFKTLNLMRGLIYLVRVSQGGVGGLPPLRV